MSPLHWGSRRTQTRDTERVTETRNQVTEKSTEATTSSAASKLHAVDAVAEQNARLMEAVRYDLKLQTAAGGALRHRTLLLPSARRE
jgi:hypothetical protein